MFIRKKIYIYNSWLKYTKSQGKQSYSRPKACPACPLKQYNQHAQWLVPVRVTWQGSNHWEIYFFFYKDSDAIFTDAHLVSADVCFCRQACTKEKMIKSANFLYETWTVTKIYQLIC